MPTPCLHPKLAPPLLLGVVALLVCPHGAEAQEASPGQPAPQERVIDKRPYDQIVLKGAGKDKLLEVLPLQLAGRRVPSPFPPGRLQVRLVSKPAVEYELNWSDVASVNLYEQMILAEGNKLTQEKNFNDAFEYYAFLNKNYPETPGLEGQIARYLQANALEAFREKQYDQALAILLSLYDRDPRSPGLGRAVDTVADKIIQDYQKTGDWRSAREVLDVVEKQFKGVDLQVAPKWRSIFQDSADKLVRGGATALQKQEYREARLAAAAAKDILPDHKMAAELQRRVEAQYPAIVVGVRTRAPSNPALRLDSPESLRIGRLARRTVTELSGYSPEGGVYTCPVGRVALDDSGSQIQFDFPTRQADSTTSAVARWLLRLADPDDAAYDGALASVASSIAVGAPGELLVRLARPHVRPEALLRHSPLSEAGVAPTEVFEISEQTPEETILIATSPESAIAEIEERYFDNDNKALKALVRGDIDVLDRVMPWQLDAVRRNRNLVLGDYELPTVHVLIPSKRSPLLEQRPLRRALLYAIDRQRILDELILGGRTDPSYQVVSGPFPTGRSLSDPIRYGYNDGVQPRPYDPRLGALLAALSWSQVQRAEHGKEDEADRPFPTLRLAHGSDPIARGACQSIQMQLGAAGIPIELVELSPDELVADSPDFDLRYAELALWEPLVDADRLLGPDGIAGRCSDPMIAALERLDNARNWVDVSSALRGVHELAAGDLSVIPLWQTVNHFAYRRGLKGVPESTVSLYQTLEGWER